QVADHAAAPAIVVGAPVPFVLERPRHRPSVRAWHGTRGTRTCIRGRRGRRRGLGHRDRRRAGKQGGEGGGKQGGAMHVRSPWDANAGLEKKRVRSTIVDLAGYVRFSSLVPSGPALKPAAAAVSAACGWPCGCRPGPPA